MLSCGLCEPSPVHSHTIRIRQEAVWTGSESTQGAFGPNETRYRGARRSRNIGKSIHGRYFQAAEITRPEADHIRLTTYDSVSNVVVISLGTSWYDVRRLTEKDLGAFVDQLVRAELELIRAGHDAPH